MVHNRNAFYKKVGNGLALCNLVLREAREFCKGNLCLGI